MINFSEAAPGVRRPRAGAALSGAFCEENNLDREKLDEGLTSCATRARAAHRLGERSRQGRALTDAGKEALETGNLKAAPLTSITTDAAPLTTFQRGELVRGALYDPNRAYVSWTLIALNLLFFFVGAAYAQYENLPVYDYLVGDDGVHRTTTHVLDKLGGLWYPPVLVHPHFARPQLERIVLCWFLHVGLIHLAMNMYFLASLGGLIESMWGRWRYVAIYVVAGIASSCAVLSYDLWQQRIGLTVGASGPLCGLFASMIVWFIFNHQHMPEDLLHDWSRTLTVNTVLLVAISLLYHVSWQGHLGGAIGGALAAVLFQVQRFHPSRSVRIAALLAVPLVPAVFLAGVFWQAGWFSPTPF